MDAGVELGGSEGRAHDPLEGGQTGAGDGSATAVLDRDDPPHAPNADPAVEDQPPPPRRRRRLPQPLVSLLVALAVVFVAYPEVLFAGGSLSNVGLNDVVHRRAPIDEVSIYPNPEGRDANSGIRDPGARSWQFEPAPRFMEKFVHDGESPYWNPYSATGSYGPETLVGVPMSPFVLTVALFGASSTAWTFVTLVFLIVSMYCVQQLMMRSLGLPRVAAIAACVVFVLNCWTASMISHAVSAPYLIFPIVLYAVVEFQRKGGPARLLAAVAAYGALIMTTFMPSLVLMMILVHSFAFAVDLARRRRDFDPGASGVVKGVGTVALRQLVVPAISLVVFAFVWLPLLGALGEASEEVETYASRELQTKETIDMLGVLTPRHAFTSYLVDTYPDDVPTWSWTFYLGLAPLILVVAALPKARARDRALLGLLLGLTALSIGMHLGLPGVTAIAKIPILTPIGPVYWTSLAAAAITLASGIAVATARRSGLSWPAGAAVGGVMLALLAAGTFGYDDAIDRAPLHFALAALTVGLAVAPIVIFGRKPARFTWLAVALVAVVGLELLSYQNHTRVERYDYEDNPPEYLTFVRENVGENRIVNIGRGGIMPEWGSAFGIRQVGTMVHTNIPHYRDFFFTFIEPGPRSKFLEVGKDHDEGGYDADPAALDLLSVKYILVDMNYRNIDAQVAEQYPLVLTDKDGRVKVYENPDAFPRAFLSTQVVPNSYGRKVDWSRDVAVTDDEQLLAEAQTVLGAEPVADPGTATLVEDHHARVVVDVDANAPALLVLADNYHEGWKVTVNGEPAHLARVDETVRGVLVPEGASTVVFQYRPPVRTRANLISLVGLVALLAACGWWAWARRRARADVHSAR